MRCSTPRDTPPIKLRAAIIPVTNFGSKLAMPLILIGLLISSFGDLSYALVYLGIADKTGERVERHVFSGDRTQVRRQAATRALEMLIEEIE